MLVVLQMKMTQIPLSLILFPLPSLPSPGLMGWEEERKMTSQRQGEASGGGSLSVCLTLTDWVVTAPIRARVEWRRLDNVSGAADGDRAGTTDIDNQWENERTVVLPDGALHLFGVA